MIRREHYAIQTTRCIVHAQTRSHQYEGIRVVEVSPPTLHGSWGPWAAGDHVVATGKKAHIARGTDQSPGLRAAGGRVGVGPGPPRSRARRTPPRNRVPLSPPPLHPHATPTRRARARRSLTSWPHPTLARRGGEGGKKIKIIARAKIKILDGAVAQYSTSERKKKESRGLIAKAIGSSRVPLVGPTAHGCPRAASLTWTEPRGVGPTPAEGERHASWGVPPTHTLVASGVGWWCEMTRLPLTGLEQTRRRGGGMRVNKRRSRGNTVARQPPVLCQSSRHCGLRYPPTTSSPSSASA